MTEAAWERDGAAAGGALSGPASSGQRIGAPATGWRIADALLAVALLTGIIVGGNLDRMPRGLEGYLALRITLKNAVLLTGFGLAWPGVLSLCGLYSPARLRTGQGEWSRLLLASAIGCAVAMVFPLTSRSGYVRPLHAVLFAVAIVPAEAILRGAVRAAQRASRNARQRRAVIVVGSGPLAVRMCRELLSDPLRAEDIIGFVDSQPCHPVTETGLAHLGGVADLERILMRQVVDDVIICLPIRSHYEEIQQTLTACARVGVPAKYPADLFRSSLGVPMVNGEVATPILSLLVAPDDPRLIIKRGIDLLGATTLLALLSPLMLVVALAVKLTSRGPVFFAQERFGYMKRRFRMLKFRTMVVHAEQMQGALEIRNEAAGPVFKIRKDPRVTRIGQLLRRTSLDELPQLWHVLTGEMSLVGPRPLPVRDVSRFAEPWLMRRFSVRPGLTCLWQISGRSELGFDDWIALDLEYIAHWSLLLDLKILLRTIPAVFGGKGAN